MGCSLRMGAQLEKTNTAQPHSLSKDRARCLLACESWAYFPPEQEFLCSCGWSVENHGWSGKRKQSKDSHREQGDHMLPPTPPHLGCSRAPRSWLTGRRYRWHLSPCESEPWPQSCRVCGQGTGSPHSREA